MSIADRMRERLSTVPVALGKGGSYKRLTSNPSFLTDRTYDAAWTPSTGVIQGRMMSQDYSASANAHTKHEMASLTIPDTVVLSLGDLWLDAEGVEWAIDGAIDGGIGTTVWRIKRELPQLGGPNRQGGV